jgi:transposase
MQLQIPIFPSSTKLINSSLGFFEKEGFVYYLHNGNPIYCHSKEDRKSYRFILGNLVVQGLCSITELSRALGEHRKNVERYAKTFREKGAEYFFSRKETRGQCYKVTEEKMGLIQEKPDAGYSQKQTFLISCGLLSYKAHYTEREGYYSFSNLLITLSFIILLRIKSIEQVKLYNPGEMGKLVGYDRIAEVRTIRNMTGELTSQNKCMDWGKDLSMQWIESETPELYYVDGHVQVYHGYLAELGKKHVSRQRLCLPGIFVIERKLLLLTCLLNIIAVPTTK